MHECHDKWLQGFRGCSKYLIGIKNASKKHSRSSDFQFVSFSRIMIQNPYLYLSSSAYLGPGRRGSRFSRDTQMSLSQTPLPAPPGEAQGVPRPAERHSPSSLSCAVPWSSSQWDVPGTPPEEGVLEA
ncbi:hypothetical protein AMECASPLE_029529 [Ameca splendens]|uniref:Uncharacterized protein n=1 Tax=Ameca splendens TaxID=208324 RepID=A0ABV0ZFK7_9TELE